MNRDIANRWFTIIDGDELVKKLTQKPAKKRAKKIDAAPSPPLCVWCSAPWTDDMLQVSAHAEMYHGYYGDSSVERIDTTVDVVCSTCNRLVYRKELRDVPHSGGW